MRELWKRLRVHCVPGVHDSDRRDLRGDTRLHVVLELPDVGVRRALLPGMHVHGELYRHPDDVLRLEQLRPDVLRGGGMHVERDGVLGHGLGVLDVHDRDDVRQQRLLQLVVRRVHGNGSPVRFVHDPDDVRDAIRLQLVDRDLHRHTNVLQRARDAGDVHDAGLHVVHRSDELHGHAHGLREPRDGRARRGPLALPAATRLLRDVGLYRAGRGGGTSRVFVTGAKHFDAVHAW